MSKRWEIKGTKKLSFDRAYGTSNDEKPKGKNEWPYKEATMSSQRWETKGRKNKLPPNLDDVQTMRKKRFVSQWLVTNGKMEKWNEHI